MTFNQNIQQAEPQLIDVLNLLKKDIFLSLNCHAIGTIQSFDSEKQLSKVTINYKKTFMLPNEVGVYVAKTKPYPVIIDAPTICLGGGDGVLTFPIEQGDECLVLFNDRNIDNWFSGSSDASVASPRMHSFSDALVLVGIRSSGKAITDYDTDGVALRYAETKVKLTDKVGISNAAFELGTLVQDLMTQLDLLVAQIELITTTVAGVPVGINNAAAFIPIQTALNTIKTEFSGLLE